MDSQALLQQSNGVSVEGYKRVCGGETVARKISLINIHKWRHLHATARKMVVPCVAGGSIAMIAD